MPGTRSATTISAMIGRRTSVTTGGAWPGPNERRPTGSKTGGSCPFCYIGHMKTQSPFNVKRLLWITPIVALGLAGAPALANGDESRAEAAEEARIPFVNHGGIRDWRAADGDTIYIQDRARRWYRAELMHRAPGL